ncbi:type VII secretion protein EccCa, partial [Mycobacterium sp.]|uniref:type VII secretion protein EccCa n=1 Tax=Mycobacterium sp. TaxID=1785 RepID=UPI003C723B7B
MSRLIFEARRRLAPPVTRKGTITIEAPPELPRVIPPSFLRRAMPFVLVILIVGMVVALFATGMRLISPQTLFFPFVLLLAATALYRGNDNKMRTEEVDAERADYLRYLSVVRDNIRTQAAQQRAAAQWSHPEPDALAAVPGSRRQWERDPHDPDFLVLRAGRHQAPLATALRVNDTADEIDLEPVSHSALRSLLDTHRTVRDVPTGIDLTKVSRITVLGEADEVRAALRAWIAQAVTWHDPTVLSVALVSRDLESPDWSWLKWLPHIDVPGELDGVGPARFLSTNPDELVSLLGSALVDRPAFTGEPADALRHFLIVVDDPDYDLNASTLAVGRAGVTVVHRSAIPPHREQYSDPEKPILRIAGGAIRRWQTGGWQPYIDSADQFGADEAAHLARRLSRWDSNPTHTGLRSAATRGATFSTLLGIPDASQLDVPTLWAPRRREDELRVPIGVTATGEPLLFDLKDEAEGGMGPHGLMIGMTGSGKSQTLMSMLLALLTTHPADRLIVIYADFKGEAGADSFRNFPQVVAVISNMAEKKSLADRFADTLRGEVARRETLLREAGRRVQGSAFNSVVEYEAAFAAGHDLAPIPTLFVVADEFTLMLADHPEYAELFDYVARKGRSFRIHILFASQTLDVGKIKDIDKNTSYRIGLKVASSSVSRQIIGVEDAYHIESGKEHKGEGFLVPAPGATPIKFRSTYVDGIYEPPKTAKIMVMPSIPEPKLFTAGRVEPDPETVIVGGEEEPPGPPRKLIATIGEQLARYGPRAPQLWLPPLDEPIPLTAVLARAGVPQRQWRWPLGEIDKPFEMRRDPLIFDATSSAGNVVIHGGAKSGKSTALQTFILSAASLHSPRDVSFYCLDYGGGKLRALEDLAHVGSVASPLEPERIRRTFGELEQLLLSRQKRGVFRDKHGSAPDDGFGEVFLIIDNLYAFGRDNTDQFNTRNPLLAKVTELVNIGLAYGIHVVITTPSWLEVPLSMRDGLGLRLELKLHDARDSNVRVVGALRRPADAVPPDQPGRGLTMAAEHFLFAAPELDQVAAINARHPGMAAPPVRLLPTNLAPEALGALYRGLEQVVIGQREEDLAPVVIDFADNPLLMVFGDSKSGKTTLLRHIIRTIREHSSADRVAFTVLDRRLHLVDEPLFPDNEYTANIDRIIPAMLGLSNL